MGIDVLLDIGLPYHPEVEILLLLLGSRIIEPLHTRQFLGNTVNEFG